MEILIIAGAVALYFAYSGGALASVGLSNSQQQTVAQQQQQIAANQQAINSIPVFGDTTSANQEQLLSLGLKGTSDSITAGQSASENGNNVALASITAGVGAVLGIGLALWKAHQLREKQAKDENSAMNIGVAGFDSDIRAVNQAFNSGAPVGGQVVDVNVAINALKQAEQQYWLLVSPHVQPGRNGCSNGNACPDPSSDFTNYCQGSIGAACCVGCESIKRSLYYNGQLPIPSGTSDSDAALYRTPGAIIALQRGGGVSRVFEVFGSKYGGNNRKGYTLTWQHP